MASLFVLLSLYLCFPIFPHLPLFIPHSSLLTPPSIFHSFRSSAGKSATSDYIDRDRGDYDDDDRGYSNSERRKPQQSHNPTRPVDKEKAEVELNLAIKKATNPDETAPKQKHVRSESSFFLALLMYRMLILERINRGYRIHLGLPLFRFNLVWTSSSTYPFRRSSDFQGFDHDS